MASTFISTIGGDPRGTWRKRMRPSRRFNKVDMPRGSGKKMIMQRWNHINRKNRRYRDYLQRKKRAAAAAEPTEADEYGFYKDDAQQELLDEDSYFRSEVYRDNIENFIGTVKIPVGIAGPLRVNGLHADGDYYIPLATTEAALVASLSRGISAINQSGGATAAVIMEGVSRDPVLVFDTVAESMDFVIWGTEHFEEFQSVASKFTRHGRLVDVKYMIDGHDVHMKCVFTSGDAAGQNMVTICTEAVLQFCLENSPVLPKMHLLEGGMSGDKKASAANLMYVRGRRVTSEVCFKRDVIQTVLHTTPEDIIRSSALGCQAYFWTGTIGVSTHMSNTITAMSIALGQDPACASEAHVGVARSWLTDEGDVYLSVTLPNLLVGSVGGGTKLPSQRACLEIMGLYGNGCANALAEVIACVCIAGEISLGSAIVTGDFAKAHKVLRGDRTPIDLENDSIDVAYVKAQAMIMKITEVPPRSTIFELYALYKQSELGDVNIDRPPMFSSIKARAKYQAWCRKKGMPRDDAKRQYVELVLRLVQEDQARILAEKREMRSLMEARKAARDAALLVTSTRRRRRH